MERDFFGISGSELAAADSDGTRNSSSSGKMISMQEGFASSISRRISLDHTSWTGLVQPLTPPNALESNIGYAQRSWITESRGENHFHLSGYQPSSSADSLVCREYLDEGWQFRHRSSPSWAQLKPTITQPSCITMPGLARPLAVSDPGRRSKEKNPADPSGATAQLTIFYAGTVNVYDDIPVDKAEAIMLMAAKDLRNSGEDGSPPMKHPARTSARTRDESEDLTMAHPKDHHKAPHASSRAIPQARKASLARFLEKRKDGQCVAILHVRRGHTWRHFVAAHWEI